MKLRLRSSLSKETLKIEIPNSCTLSQLKQNLAQFLPNSPSPDSIRLSLNRKDELQSDDGDNLISLGITTGDMIYFSLEQPAVSLAATTSSNSSSQNTLPQVTGSTNFNTANTLPMSRKSDSSVSEMDLQTGENSDRVSQMEETLEEMEVDDRDNNENSYGTAGMSADEVVNKSFSVPGVLRKVFIEELGNDAGKDHKLIIIAVHAVMLETGFVGFDKNSNMVVNGFHFRNEWPSPLFRVSLYYTLQESLGCASVDSFKNVIVLKFQSLGQFINVYGTLQKRSGAKITHRVQLNEDQLVPFLNVVWANCGVVDNIDGENGGSLGTSPEKEVFKFWRSVKDDLALPLLIDFCEEFGLELPPCFTRLPTDLKLKILESLPGVDIAKTSCVCSELRYLGSSDDLWKMKFAEEFGDGPKEAQGNWREAFVKDWGMRRSRKVNNRARGDPFWAPSYLAQPRKRKRNPFMVPRLPFIIGGDYDILPPFEDGRHTTTGNDLINRTMGSLGCNLGVRGGRFV